MAGTAAETDLRPQVSVKHPGAGGKYRAEPCWPMVGWSRSSGLRISIPALTRWTSPPSGLRPEPGNYKDPISMVIPSGFSTTSNGWVWLVPEAHGRYARIVIPSVASSHWRVPTAPDVVLKSSISAFTSNRLDLDRLEPTGSCDCSNVDCAAHATNTHHPFLHVNRCADQQSYHVDAIL